MATTFGASLRPTRTRILLIALAFALLLGYGLFTAQRARGASGLAKKAFTGVKVSAGTLTLINPIHVTAVSYIGPGTTTGDYVITFDRHVDNCSFSVTNDLHGGTSFSGHAFGVANGPGLGKTTSQELVEQFDSSSHASVDGDFDIIALCPGT